MQPVLLVDKYSDRADWRACEGLLRHGSRSFFAAAAFLPSRIRVSATALYAFCRIADDAIDQGGDAKAALGRLHARLDALYAGRPANFPADRAFADCVYRHRIPKSLPLALLEGFAWDVENRRYQTLDDLLAYASRVAGTVGVMMAIIVGVRDEVLLAGACDLGVAMQLTNIARDVGEDARQGRLYLPLSWLEEAGVAPDQWLATPAFAPDIGCMVQRLLTASDSLYERSDVAIRQLPRTVRPGIVAARLLYSEIGRQVTRNGFDSVTRRAVVSRGEQVKVLARALFASPSLPKVTACVSPEAASLLCGWVSEPVATTSQQRPSLTARMLWVLDLFERLERRAGLLGRQ